MLSKPLQSLLKKLPHSPGVYKMKDEDGRILYIGKAKDLSKRVRSYFQDQKKLTVRTQKLLEKVADLEWVEVSSDLEALFLETNFIKEFRPKYNVLMKDDKNFVYIKITKNEDFPRIEVVRRVEKDGARYFGPKTAAHTVKKTLALLQKLFNYRSCDLGIEWKNGKAEVIRKTMAYPCLDYHIKRCAGPCISEISPEEYKKSITQIERFLEGDTKSIEDSLKVQMETQVENKEFEKAAKTRDKLQALQSLFHEQVVTSPDHQNADILGFVLENGKAYFNLFMLRDGKLCGQENFIAEAAGCEAGDEPGAAEVVEAFLTQYYEKATAFPREILLPLELEEFDFFETWLSNQADHRVRLVFPKRGKKHALASLAEKNARSFQKQHKARWEHMQPSDEEALLELAEHLELSKVPKRMEAYDISHLGGSDTVASMVVFENGKPKKSDYRKFHLRSIVDGEIDDFKSMSEILARRLRYLKSAPKGFEFRKAAKTYRVGIALLFKEWRGEDDVDGALDEYTVALKNKKVIGLVRLVKGKEKSYLLKSLYISPKVRAQGLGSGLLRYAIQKLKAKRVYVSCIEKMRDFYLRFGFEEVKQFPEEFLNDLKEVLFAYNPSKTYDASFQSKPDLIVIDGGKGQLGAALKSRDFYGLEIPMIGLAKREEDVFVPGKSFPLLIPKDSPALYLLQRIRNEAHRFAITFQKDTRAKSMFK